MGWGGKAASRGNAPENERERFQILWPGQERALSTKRRKSSDSPLAATTLLASRCHHTPRLLLGPTDSIDLSLPAFFFPLRGPRSLSQRLPRTSHKHPSRALEQSPARASPLEERDIRSLGRKTLLFAPPVENTPTRRSPTSHPSTPRPPENFAKTAPSVLYRSAGRGARPASGGRPSVSRKGKSTLNGRKNQTLGGKGAATLRINVVCHSGRPRRKTSCDPAPLAFSIRDRKIDRIRSFCRNKWGRSAL